jgi:hypothetical protein
MFTYNYLLKFNPELRKVSQNILQKHIQIHKKNSKIITSIQDFQLYNPTFNILWYQLFNEDLYHLSKIDLCLHFHIYGKNENRIYNNIIYESIYRYEENINNRELGYIKSKMKLTNIIYIKKIYSIIIKLRDNFETELKSNIAISTKKYYINFMKNIFDYNFYQKIYLDIQEQGLQTYQEYFSHWLKNGIKEGRKCNLIDLQTNYQDNLKKSQLYINNWKTTNKSVCQENKINILIRTCYRPDNFKKCIKSILNQKYENFQVYICYDKPECKEYLKDYKKDNIQYFEVSVDSREKYKFNLYCNILLDKVTDGWIMFLDDDDMLTHPNNLELINSYINTDNSILIWKFMRPDITIYPKNINNIKFGEIDSTSFLFHSKYKNDSIWIDKRGSDYHFISNLIEKIKPSLIQIPFTITSTNYNNKIANYGT